MQSENYKKFLKASLQNLVNANQSIFDSLIPLSMQGELKEWNEAVPIGEIHQFDFDLFKNSEDINIQHLVKLIETIDETYETIRNINGIEIEK